MKVEKVVTKITIETTSQNSVKGLVSKIANSLIHEPELVHLSLSFPDGDCVKLNTTSEVVEI